MAAKDQHCYPDDVQPKPMEERAGHHNPHASEDE
jgi:hypothetical protein